jgi:hypothetical protein
VAQFQRAGTIWEFHHPRGGKLAELERKPHTPYNKPYQDYLGYKPLIVTAQICESEA